MSEQLSAAGATMVQCQNKIYYSADESRSDACVVSDSHSGFSE